MGTQSRYVKKALLFLAEIDVRPISWGNHFALDLLISIETLSVLVNDGLQHNPTKMYWFRSKIDKWGLDFHPASKMWRWHFATREDTLLYLRAQD